MDEENVENSIGQLKAAYRAATEGELARALGVSRSTISSWRNRGAVPLRYLTNMPGNNKSAFTAPPAHWTDEEREAFNIALLRMLRSEDSEFSTYQDYLRRSGFVFSNLWIEMMEAKRAILAMADDNDGMDVPRAAQLVAYKEFYPEDD